MHILLLGKRGQLGFELNRHLATEYKLTALDSSQLDLTRPEQIKEVIKSIRPDLLINAAAYTAVDKAETEQEQAAAINAHAPEVIATELAKTGASLIHYSTDYVFDGDADRPYRETDCTNPRSVYGRTKLEGERAIQASDIPALIFRTSWVYGEYGNNFLLTMRRLLQERSELGVVNDQTGSPTWSRELAKATCCIISQSGGRAEWFEKKKGLYHISCAGQTTWYEFAVRIAQQLEQQGKQIARINPVTTAEYPTSAARPKYSVLDNSLLSDHLPEWKDFFKEPRINS